MDTEMTNILLKALENEISPSYAMKITMNNSNDLWADNLQDFDSNNTIFPSSPVSCSLGHPLVKSSSNNIISLTPTKGEYYNFNFRMGAPIGSTQEFYNHATPTFTHG